MSAVMIVLLAMLGYLIVALGVLRWEMPRQYDHLRTPRNGVQMPEDDARRATIRLACQTAFTWPLLLCAFGLLAPMIVVFDGIPAAGRAAGRGATAAGRAAAPALAPVTNWATKPLDAAVNRDRQLALSARADEPVPDVPLVPDEIATWVDPRFRGRTRFEREVNAEMERLRHEIEHDRPTYLDQFAAGDPLIEFIRESDVRRTRREEA